MAGRVRDKKVQARRATSLALSQDDAKKVLERVNTARMRLHDRLATLVIFKDPLSNTPATRAHAGDHPLVQILLAMRDHADAIDANPALAPSESAQAKTKMLEAMARTTSAIVAEAGRASIEVRAMAESMMAMEQRAKEHRDKMEVLRAKVSPAALARSVAGEPRTTADILRDLGPDPIVVLDDGDPLADHPGDAPADPG